MIEDRVRTFAGNWTGSGTITGAGDSERIELSAGESMDSEVVNTGPTTVALLYNTYAAGDTVILAYRHGVTQLDCESSGWVPYTVPFTSLGYVQVRVEVTA